MDILGIVVTIAVIVEAVIQVIKAGIPEGVEVPAWLWPTCSALIGVVLCVLADVDALSLLGVNLTVPVVGNVVTGILVSRGASFVHDLWSRINGDKPIE